MNLPRPLDFLLVPLGSEGDVAPFIWMGDRLRERGHRVRIAANPHFAPLIEQRGHAHVAVGSMKQLDELVQHPRLWDGVAGAQLLLQFVLQTLPECTHQLLSAVQHADVVVGSTFALAGSLAAEREGKPFVRVHLQPAALRSVHDLPVLGSRLGWLRRWPSPALRAFFRAADAVLDARPLRELNAFRRTLGLPAVGSFYRDVFNRGAAIAALFPSWYAPPQPDWPVHLRQFSFPLAPAEADAPLPEPVRTFLASGTPPVLWTHGSANHQADAFLTAAAAACSELGVRGILVAPGVIEQPGETGRGLLRLAYAPFAALFPHCRAVVHHGGIGTLAKALRAGRPQLIVPRAYDQFDNAARAERLGFGQILAYHRLSRAPKRLQAILEMPRYAERAQALAPRVVADHTLVGWLESFAKPARG